MRVKVNEKQVGRRKTCIQQWIYITGGYVYSYISYQTSRALAYETVIVVPRDPLSCVAMVNTVVTPRVMRAGTASCNIATHSCNHSDTDTIETSCTQSQQTLVGNAAVTKCNKTFVLLTSKQEVTVIYCIGDIAFKILSAGVILPFPYLFTCIFGFHSALMISNGIALTSVQYCDIIINYNVITLSYISPPKSNITISPLPHIYSLGIRHW